MRKLGVESGSPGPKLSALPTKGALIGHFAFGSPRPGCLRCISDPQKKPRALVRISECLSLEDEISPFRLGRLSLQPIKLSTSSAPLIDPTVIQDRASEKSIWRIKEPSDPRSDARRNRTASNLCQACQNMDHTSTLRRCFSPVGEADWRGSR